MFGHFVRVLVEVDLSKPLQEYVMREQPGHCAFDLFRSLMRIYLLSTRNGLLWVTLRLLADKKKPQDNSSGAWGDGVAKRAAAKKAAVSS